MLLRLLSIHLLTLLLVCFVACNEDPVSSFDPVDNTEEPWHPPTGFSLRTTRAGWQMSSEPAHFGGNPVRTKMLWHNPIDAVPASDVYRDDFLPGEGVVRPFRMIFRPAQGEPSWAGITKYCGPCVYITRLQAFEMHVKGDRGKLHFDFGRVNDDINGNVSADSEEQGLRNGIYDPGEDIGLDGMSNTDEEGYDPYTLPDPNGDNWFFLGSGVCPVQSDSCGIVEHLQDSVRNDGLRSDLALHYYYEWLNGTEGNKEDLAMGHRPDREGYEWGFSTNDAYLSYTVDLANDSLVVPGSESYGSSGIWRTIRIPILDTLAIDTAVGLSAVDPISLFGDGLRQVRVWFEGDGSSNTPDTVEIAAWYFDHDEATIPVGDYNRCPWRNVPENETTDGYLRDYEYQEGRIFDLGYAGEIAADDIVTKLFVFEEITSFIGHEVEAIYDCILTINGDTAGFPSQLERMTMVQIREDEFSFHNDPRYDRHYVHFKSPSPHGTALGFYMEIRRADYTVDIIGDLMRPDDSLVLKVLRSTEATYTPDHPSWDLMWRNVYSLPKGVDVEDLDIRVFKGLPGTETSPDNLDYQTTDNRNEGYYIEILGLDQINNNTGGPLPDQQVDPSIDIFNSEWGLLIFPHRTPFASDTTFLNQRGQTQPLRDHVDAIYNYYSPAERVADSRYYLRFSQSSRSTSYQLPCTNIRPYTEIVQLNGHVLQRDVDYLIDYASGTIRWLKGEATDPNADVVILFPPYTTVPWLNP